MCSSTCSYLHGIVILSSPMSIEWDVILNSPPERKTLESRLGSSTYSSFTKLAIQVSHHWMCEEATSIPVTTKFYGCTSAELKIGESITIFLVHCMKRRVVWFATSSYCHCVSMNNLVLCSRTRSACMEQSRWRRTLNACVNCGTVADPHWRGCTRRVDNSYNDGVEEKLMDADYLLHTWHISRSCFLWSYYEKLLTYSLDVTCGVNNQCWERRTNGSKTNTFVDSASLLITFSCLSWPIEFIYIYMVQESCAWACLFVAQHTCLALLYTTPSTKPDLL